MGCLMEAPRFPSLSPGVVDTPDPEKVNAAGQELLEAKRCLLKAAHYLDDSPTRMLNAEVAEIGDLVDHSMVKLTEWGGS
jgi:hypothetical protein